MLKQNSRWKMQSNKTSPLLHNSTSPDHLQQSEGVSTSDSNFSNQSLVVSNSNLNEIDALPETPSFLSPTHNTTTSHLQSSCARQDAIDTWIVVGHSHRHMKMSSHNDTRMTKVSERSLSRATFSPGDPSRGQAHVYTRKFMQITDSLSRVNDMITEASVVSRLTYSEIGQNSLQSDVSTVHAAEKCAKEKSSRHSWKRASIRSRTVTKVFHLVTGLFLLQRMIFQLFLILLMFLERPYAVRKIPLLHCRWIQRPGLPMGPLELFHRSSEKSYAILKIPRYLRSISSAKILLQSWVEE